MYETQTDMIEACNLMISAMEIIKAILINANHPPQAIQDLAFMQIHSLFQDFNRYHNQQNNTSLGQRLKNIIFEFLFGFISKFVLYSSSD